MSRSLRICMAILALGFLACTVAAVMRPAPAAAAAAPVDITRLDFLALCDAYRQDHSAQLLAELTHRADLPPGEVGPVMGSQVFVGMSRSGLVCSRGWPQDVRTTTSSYGTVEWYSYTAPHLLVRLDDGKVASFTD